ncbi:hypothetical protein BpHYR1_016887 [Brachionus plicatilis]|uniref:Uncharacterized protein n=1 Tax=Brachionus plicatilis TaxID=10195 RepID=A0A3M7RGB4_BRAPC|nr:hypothetical protein BpHYR1_016887 [Brachionus plicatilis]
MIEHAQAPLTEKTHQQTQEQQQSQTKTSEPQNISVQHYIRNKKKKSKKSKDIHKIEIKKNLVFKHSNYSDSILKENLFKKDLNSFFIFFGSTLFVSILLILYYIYVDDDCENGFYRS